jgi:membrane associated rhomboid family serine protease/Flp pilus assembly protein TadD
LPQCSQCGREVDSQDLAGNGEAACSQCLQNSFAARAEDSALRGSQYEFVITNLLLLVNIAVYLWMVVGHAQIGVLLRHLSAWSPTTDQVIRWGGNYGPLTLGTQPWRLVSCLFMHLSPAHLIANMWALFVLGRLAESLYGRWSYLAAYLLSGLAGSLASLLWNPLGVSAGASGAIFGIAGALIATLFVGKLPLPQRSIRPVLLTLVFWAGFDLLYGIWKAGVDNAAHIGGLLAGLILGVLVGHYLGPQREAKAFRQKIIAGGTIFILLFAFFVWRRNGYVVQVERARNFINIGKADDAVRELQQVVLRKPNEPYVHLLLGEAFLKKSDFAHAEQEYKKVTEAKPKDQIGWTNLAQTYAAEEKYADAANAWLKSAELAKGGNAAVAWFQAGNMYYHLNRDQDAIQAYQRTVALAPNYPEPWGSLGVMQMKVGQNDQAIVSLGRAVRLLPGNPELRVQLGNAYMRAGKEQEAQEQFFQASKLSAAQQERMRQLRQNSQKK